MVQGGFVYSEYTAYMYMYTVKCRDGKSAMKVQGRDISIAETKKIRKDSQALCIHK